MPHLYHYESILDKATGKTTYKKQYSGGPIWGDVETLGGKGGGEVGLEHIPMAARGFREQSQGQTTSLLGHW